MCWEENLGPNNSFVRSFIHSVYGVAVSVEGLSEQDKMVSIPGPERPQSAGSEDICVFVEMGSSPPIGDH